MYFKNIRVKVTSRTFSKNDVLKKELLEIFPNSIFNTKTILKSSKDLFEFLSDADAIILGLEKIDRKVLEKLSKLKIIAKYGVGLDNLDIKSAKEFGIEIGWTGGVNKRSVAEQALAFMIGLRRNLFFSSFSLKEGKWNKEGGSLLSNCCVGIIGCGNIGSDLVHLLNPFNCRILICDLLDKKKLVDKYAITQVSLDKLLKKADIVSLHVPLTTLTHLMVDEEFLRKLKPSAHLINTSRGPIVSQKALKIALEQNTISGAALDVFETEPPQDLEFLSLPNLMITPHIGGNANESILAMGRSAIEHLKKYFFNDSKN